MEIDGKEYDELLKDALRYRWLWTNEAVGAGTDAFPYQMNFVVPSKFVFNHRAAIDAAIQGEKK